MLLSHYGIFLFGFLSGCSLSDFPQQFPRITKGEKHKAVYWCSLIFSFNRQRNVHREINWHPGNWFQCWKWHWSSRFRFPSSTDFSKANSIPLDLLIRFHIDLSWVDSWNWLTESTNSTKVMACNILAYYTLSLGPRPCLLQCH